MWQRIGRRKALPSRSPLAHILLSNTRSVCQVRMGFVRRRTAGGGRHNPQLEIFDGPQISDFVRRRLLQHEHRCTNAAPSVWSRDQNVAVRGKHARPLQRARAFCLKSRWREAPVSKPSPQVPVLGNLSSLLKRGRVCFGAPDGGSK